MPSGSLHLPPVCCKRECKETNSQSGCSEISNPGLDVGGKDPTPDYKGVGEVERDMI